MSSKDFVCEHLRKIVKDLYIQNKLTEAAAYSKALAVIESFYESEFEYFIKTKSLSTLPAVGIAVAQKITDLLEFKKSSKKKKSIIEDKLVTRKTLPSLESFFKESHTGTIKIFEIPFQNPFEVSVLIQERGISCAIEIEPNSLLLCLSE